MSTRHHQVAYATVGSFPLPEALWAANWNTVAKNELNDGGDDDDENYEFRGGAAARRRKGGKKKGKDEMIKSNIESGNLWKQ